MAKSNAVKRLERILSDEEYGPKLVRLNRKDEAYVLDLIDRNKGREARKEILRLDAERLARRRQRPSTRLPTIAELRAKARKRFETMVGHLPKYEHDTVVMSTKLMTKDELVYATTASRSDIQGRASEPSIPYPDLDMEWNVFWYH